MLIWRTRPGGHCAQPALCLLLVGSATAVDDLILEGQIKSFEGGDNRYLTITIQDDGELSALCTSPECEPRNVEAAIPEDLIGAVVPVHAGAGLQVDGSGNIMGLFPAFTSIALN